MICPICSAVFAEPEHHFGKSGAQMAVMIDAREPEILERQIGKLVQSVVDADIARVYAIEELTQLLRIHEWPSLV